LVSLYKKQGGHMPLVSGSTGFVRVGPPVIQGVGAPPATFKGELGQLYYDTSTSPATQYAYNGSTWVAGGDAPATTTTYGSVILTDNNEPVATKFYADNLAIAGAPAWSETVSGIGQLSTNAEAVAGTNDDTAMTPLKVAAALAGGLPITGGAGSFTTLAASGLSSLSGSATILTAGTALNLASDADTAAVNIGTGAAARVITLGNVSGATAVAVNTGTGHFTVTTTGSGDIILNSDDTMLLDADGVLELNSSAGAIGIGNDADSNAINIGTAGARTITLGNSTGATSLVLDAGTGALNVGTNAIAHTITIGNTTGATALVENVGTGNYVLDGVAGSTYTIGASTTTGTIAIGGTAQTGTLSVGVSSGIMTSNYSTGNGAKTVNIATGVSGNTVNLASGINTSAQTVNISTGASGANSTVAILTGNGSAGTQTLNVLTGNRAGALNLATGSAAHVIAVGSASAGAVTVDTAAGISLDAATASNFTVTGASADLSLLSAGGSVILRATESAADAVTVEATTGGIDILASGAAAGEDIDIIATGSSVNIQATESDVNAITINASGVAGGINVDAGTSGVIVDTTGAVSLDSAAASNFTVTGAFDLTLASSAGSVNITAGESAADSIVITSSAGGIDILASGAAAGEDIDIVATGSSVNITSTENVTDAIVINASGAASALQLDAGTGGLRIGTGMVFPVTSKATADTPYTALGTDYIINCDTSGGVLQITLPAATALAGRSFVIKDAIGNAAVNNITINGGGTNLVGAGSSAATKTLAAAYSGATVYSNGTVWLYFYTA
jgi:hypothetical protein